MEQAILSRIDSLNQLHRNSSLELSINPANTLAQQPVKIYQVINDMFKTRIVEHDVVKVTDGSTRYNAITNRLVQGLRVILQKGLKVDLFNNQAADHYTYQRRGKTYDLLNYFFTSKEKAEKKLQDENYRLLVKTLLRS